MQPLQPSRNDRLLSRARSERFIKPTEASRHMMVAESCTTFKAPHRRHLHDFDEDEEENKEHHHDASRSSDRRNRRSAMGRAKSMRQMTSSSSSSRRKEKSLLQDDKEKEDEHQHRHRHHHDDHNNTSSPKHDDENDNKESRPKPRRSKSSDGADMFGSSSSSHHKRGSSRRSSRHDMMTRHKSMRDMKSSEQDDMLSMSKSSHDPEDHKSGSSSSKRSSRRDPLSSSKSSHEMMTRHMSMRDLNNSKQDDMLSMSKSMHVPAGQKARPAMARRSSLSNLTASFLGTSSHHAKSSKGKDKADADAQPVAIQMSKAKATGPYEGVALIQCDLQVHCGAELVAKNRQFSIAGRASSNPFIEVWQNLPTKMVGKTKTVHKTLAPTYDESFYLQWTEQALSRCLSKSHQAKVILKIWDADRISGREAMGEVSIPLPLPGDCNQVKRQWFLVDKDSARNASGRLQVSLSIVHVMSEDE